MERIFQYPSNSGLFEGLIATVPTPRGWMSEQPVILTKLFNASEQQFQAFEPLGTIFVPIAPPPQGWMGQQPNFEILIPQFNSGLQQFSTTPGINSIVIAALIVTEADDILLASVTVGDGPPVLATMVATGVNTDAMQLLGFSATEFLFYDEPNTQCFYLKQIPEATVLKVSPAFAKFWLVDSGRLSTLVYNPFANLLVSMHLSNEL
jgi:hypothetical protein